MREEGEIRQKLKQAQFRHLKRLLRSRFSSKGDWPKDEVDKIKSEVRDFFQKAPLHEIAAEYPDVAALLWVLEARDSNPLLPGGTLVGRMDGVVLWADTEEEAEHARRIIDEMASQIASRPVGGSAEAPVEGEWEEAPDFFEVPPTDLEPLPSDKALNESCAPSWWQRWFG